jgi:hypothetical protein
LEAPQGFGTLVAEMAPPPRSVRPLAVGALAIGLVLAGRDLGATGPPVSLESLRAGCQGSCRLVVGQVLPVGADLLTVVLREEGGPGELFLHSHRLGRLGAGELKAALAAQGRMSVADLKNVARLVLALRTGDPEAAIYATPEELARLAPSLRRRIGRDDWPRTDPEENGRAVVTGIVHRQSGGRHRLDRLVVVIARDGETWLAGGAVLHCEAGWPSGCGLTSIP